MFKYRLREPRAGEIYACIEKDGQTVDRRGPMAYPDAMEARDVAQNNGWANFSGLAEKKPKPATPKPAKAAPKPKKKG